MIYGAYRLYFAPEALNRECVTFFFAKVNIVAIFYSEVIGESLFTLFASLTYAYHYLMTLIK